MMTAVLKLAILAALVILTLGVFPNRRAGAAFALAIGVCIAGAVILHLVAP